MTAVNKKSTESKYVSLFADSRPDVDVTFRDVILSRPTDHYLVGVDDFNMTSTNLSMIEPLSGDYEDLIRIVRNRPGDAINVGDDLTTSDGLDAKFQAVVHYLYAQPGGPPYLEVINVGFSRFAIKTSEVILSTQQLMYRLNQVAGDVNDFMNQGHARNANAFDGEFGYVNEDGENTEHLRFDLRSDGHMKIIGTRAFWGCFSIEIPSVQYQFGFHGARATSDDNPLGLRRFLSVNPATGAKTFGKILVNPIRKDATEQGIDDATAVARRAHNSRCVGGQASTAQVIVLESALDGVAANTFNIHSGANAKRTVTLVTRASLFSTMERRVALELGCSLPVKNSPMIDHQKESPDFVLGRWMWRTDSRIDSNDRGGSNRFASAVPASIQYQGPRDRVTYHELQAQAKIQTLRVKLFARVRSFNETDEKWGMRVVILPTESTDWWHVRLHFISKD